VLAFDVGPPFKPVNPVFEPVMICGDCEKSEEEQQERPVTGVVVFQPVETHGDEQSDQKQDASPSGELCAGAGSLLVSCLASPEQAGERVFASGGGVVGLHDEIDHTGNGLVSSIDCERETMMQEWVDVSIHSAVDPGELLGLLGDPQVRGAWEDQGVTHLYWSRDHWSGDRLGQVRAALDQLDPSGQSSGAVHVGDLPHQDWNRQWAQSVKPLRVGRRLVIRPSWESASLLGGDLDIILDPKQAFGTGHHATTRMLLEWLEELIRGGETVLDVGSGSGILAMAALRLGAQSAVGIEIDPVAVDCARECAGQNAFGSELELVCGTLSDVAMGKRPDLVVANIDRQTLLLLADELAAYGAAGSRLFFSGLLLEQVDEVMARYTSLGLYLVHRREQDGWVALELQCVDPCEGSG
jgi:ribosomal protein L11 methyltransferase